MEDGDLDFDFPEKPPELDYDQFFAVDSKATDIKLLKDENLEDYTVL